MYQRFSEAVGDYLVSRYIREVNSTSGYLISDVVVLDIDVFDSRMKDWIVGKGNRALVVTFQKDWGSKVQLSSRSLTLFIDFSRLLLPSRIFPPSNRDAFQ